MVNRKLIRELAEIAVIAVIAVFIIRAFVVQAFRIPTGSMENTLVTGDFLLVNKCVYGAEVPFIGWRLPKFRNPEPGDVIIFKYPEDPEIDYIKRLIAVGGQTVEIRDKELYVDGIRYEDPPGAQNIYSLMPKGIPDPDIFPPGADFNRDNYGPYTVPEGHLFMMGDNRDNSLDSRYWGPLPEDYVIGKAMVIYWSWDSAMPLLKKLMNVRWSRIGDIIQ